MTTSPLPTTLGPDQPHLVSLVLQSKKALQHGEHLCSRASALSSSSVQSVVDVLALDAKVRWMTDAVLEQLKLAAHVAKSIELRRLEQEKRAAEWDAIRNQRTDTLDTVLVSLGSQSVPPDFYSTSSGSSPFGSQLNSDEEHDDNPIFSEQQPGTSPTETLRNEMQNENHKAEGSRLKKSTWKTLRDFVDERAIEDVLDTIESDRNALDDIFARTSGYPESLSRTISAIQNAVSIEPSLLSIDDIFNVHEETSHEMAGQLESLARHYDQMSSALRDSETGEELLEDDLQAMNRDTEELPAIISELEDGVSSIEASHEQLLTAKRTAEQHLDTHRKTLDDLDELGDIMTEMLERQEAVESESNEHLAQLHHHLLSIDDLQHRFASYQYSYNKLLLELERRRQYRNSAEEIVKGMMAQLDAMTEEERQLREEFNAEHGQYLPEDVCLYVQNPSTRWAVVPWNGEQAEVLLDVEGDLLREANERINAAERGLGNNSQSL
ncbi:autophagy protein Apg17-domain-containing protein [Sparassis latifolia]|uniref:Autophagy-related protein 17 n=1 Tax=Sparassis crispa TaxID=139825 RepID=A0A401H049_9APHY|nr:hypothetical protein SCP_1200170 [Sparassis crispa]GBE87793.1 hypothetical protein SCP_1200170 [Sparassis crispa]